MDSQSVYDLKTVKLPYLSGGLLKLFTSLVEGPLGGLVVPGLLESAGIAWMRRQVIEEAPTHQPIHHVGEYATEDAAVRDGELPTAAAAPSRGFHFSTAFDYARAYRDGVTSPEEVAAKVLDAIAASDEAAPPLRAVIFRDREDALRQARAAGLRIKAGRALGAFDGVPVAVKDELDMRPYPTKVGTSFLGTSPAARDAAVVSRLRAAGAVLVGKTNMHEIGINVTGLNPHHGTVRNPYDTGHYSGGSSSGSAAAVAAGLVPVAVGADGGGSIRIPAAFCGVFGLKPTFGRVSEFGAAPLCWSVAHVGPIAASAADLALAYGVMAGPDRRDPNSLFQPRPTLEGWDTPDLRGLKLGIYPEWFRHAETEVVAACEAMLDRFKEMGAELREVAIPDLELSRVAHTVTIAGEMAQAMSYTYAEHHREHGLDVRLNLALGRYFTAGDYLLAQRARTRIIRNFREALEGVDMILTPATAIAPPAIKRGALPDGDSDLSVAIEIMRFAAAGNFTGLPAVAFPAGYTKRGLPVGMQAMGGPWRENLLLRLAANAERVLERQGPRVHFRIL